MIDVPQLRSRLLPDMLIFKSSNHPTCSVSLSTCFTNVCKITSPDCGFKSHHPFQMNFCHTLDLLCSHCCAMYDIITFCFYFWYFHLSEIYSLNIFYRTFYLWTLYLDASWHMKDLFFFSYSGGSIGHTCGIGFKSGSKCQKWWAGPL